MKNLFTRRGGSLAVRDSASKILDTSSTTRCARAIDPGDNYSDAEGGGCYLGARPEHPAGAESRRSGNVFKVAAALLVVGFIILTACSAPNNWRAGVWVNKNGAGVTASGSAGPDAYTPTQTPGLCPCGMTFKGPNGIISTIPNVPPGRPVAIPTGATQVSKTGVIPGSGPAGNGPTGNMADIDQGDGYRRTNAQPAPYVYWVYVQPTCPVVESDASNWSLNANVVAYFEYTTHEVLTHQDLLNLVDPYLSTDIGTQPPLPQGLQCFGISRLVPNASGERLRLYVTDRTSSVDEFEFRLNGVTTATLDQDSLYYSGLNGWKVVEVEIASDTLSINSDGTSSNLFEVTLDTAESRASEFGMTLDVLL